MGEGFKELHLPFVGQRAEKRNTHSNHHDHLRFELVNPPREGQQAELLEVQEQRRFGRKLRAKNLREEAVDLRLVKLLVGAIEESGERRGAKDDGHLLVCCVDGQDAGDENVAPPHKRQKVPHKRQDVANKGDACAAHWRRGPRR